MPTTIGMKGRQERTAPRHNKAWGCAHRAGRPPGTAGAGSPGPGHPEGRWTPAGDSLLAPGGHSFLPSLVGAWQPRPPAAPAPWTPARTPPPTGAAPAPRPAVAVPTAASAGVSPQPRCGPTGKQAGSAGAAARGGAEDLAATHRSASSGCREPQGAAPQPHHATTRPRMEGRQTTAPGRRQRGKSGARRPGGYRRGAGGRVGRERAPPRTATL